MDMSILELVLQKLQEDGFAVGVAYPGQTFPRITDVMAAVHIEKVDRSNLTVTVEANILCPGSMGGTECETEALRAVETLRRAGGSCVQQACRYDGISQMYVVPVLATFTCMTWEGVCVMGPGFQAHINGIRQKFAVRFQGTEEREYQAEYEMGQTEPTELLRSPTVWHLELEELIPAGFEPTPEPGETFELKISTLFRIETYSGCRWLSVKREYTGEGLRRSYKGIAMAREAI